MKRVLIYSHDTYGLGNVRRMLEITAHLVAVDPALSVLLVTGSPVIHAFRIPDRVDYIKLPCVGRSEQGVTGVKSLALDYAATMRMRANMILMAALDFAPDLILIDKKPLGIDDELEPMLEALRLGPGAPRVALLLRDILDEPSRTRRQWQQGRYHAAVARHCDSILVVGEAEVFDVAAAYDFPPETAAKVRYCGYLARPGAHASRQQVRAEFGLGADEPMVLVTAGGGADGHRLLQTHLDGLRHAGDRPGFSTVMVSGPEMPAEQRLDLARQARELPRVVFREFASDMLGCIAAADLVVCMGGYNTVCEFLTLRQPAIVVPRVVPSLEQSIRAERMHACGLLQCIDPARLTPAVLLEAIRAQLADPSQRLHVLARFEMRGLAGVEAEVDVLLAGVAPSHDARGRPAEAEALSLDSALQALTRGFARNRLSGGPALAW